MKKMWWWAIAVLGILLIAALYVKFSEEPSYAPNPKSACSLESGGSCPGRKEGSSCNTWAPNGQPQFGQCTPSQPPQSGKDGYLLCDCKSIY